MRTSSLVWGFPLLAGFGCGDSAATSSEDHGEASSSTGLDTWGTTGTASSTDPIGTTGSGGAPSTEVSGDLESTGASEGAMESSRGDSTSAEGSATGDSDDTSMPPSCPPEEDPCIETSVVEGQCVETALPDGASCGSSACRQSCEQGVCQVASIAARTPVDELRTFALGGDLPEVFLGDDRVVFLDEGDREGPSSLSLARKVDDTLQLVDQTPAWSLRPELASPWLWTMLYTGALAAVDDTHFVYAASNHGLALYDVGDDALNLRSEWPLYSDSPEVFDIAVLGDRVWTCGNHRLSEYAVAQEQLSWVRNVPLASICFYTRRVGSDLLLLTSTGLFVASIGDEVTVTELLSGNFLDLAVGEEHVATRRVINAAGYGDVEVYERDALLAGEAPEPVFVLPVAEVNAASVGVVGDALLVVENRLSEAEDAIEWWAQLYSLVDDFAPLGSYWLGAAPGTPAAVAKSYFDPQHAVIHPFRTVLEREGETLRKVTGPQQGSLANLTSLDEETVVALSPVSYHRLHVATGGAIDIVHGGQTDGAFYASRAVVRSPQADPILRPWPQQSETAKIPVVAPHAEGLELLGVWTLAGGPAALDGAGGWIHQVAPLTENGATFRVERFAADTVLDAPVSRSLELTLTFPPHLIQAASSGPRSFTLDGGRSLLISQRRSDGAAIDPSHSLVLAWFSMSDDDDPVLLASATWEDVGDLFAVSSEGNSLAVQTVTDVRIFRREGQALRELQRLGAQSQASAEHLSYTLPHGAMQSGLLYVAEQRIVESGTLHGLAAFDIASLARVATYEGFARPVVQVQEVGDWLWLSGVSYLWVAEPPCRDTSSGQGS